MGFFLKRSFLIALSLASILMSLPSVAVANLDLRVLREEKGLFESNKFQRAPGLLELQPEVIYIFEPETKRNAQVRIEFAVLLQETNIPFRELELRTEVLAPLSQALQLFKISELVTTQGGERVIDLVFKVFAKAYPTVIVENVEIKALVIQNDEMFPS